MRVHVRLFAILRERAGWREREVHLEPGSSIEDAWNALVALAPALAPSRDSIRFARNRTYAAADEELVDGDELALIPPIAGGADATAAREHADIRWHQADDWIDGVPGMIG